MIVIVTDSTACLNRQEVERLGVTHVPMTYTLDGVTHREHFVEETFDGSLPAFLAAFTSRKKLSKKEIDELQDLIDKMRG